ncbi:hypothetical protein [Rubellimicrobium sp. CFH 75288]|uniref:hypothetical protein n=1 Tax=Rubellimicrobium sp. CFH 75288 TaxID=2697034 RepID=UPI00141360DE|nr:hypothetical protein [Rubellimicrobium sp. CFH 75288]NAZ37190.1 hypothetical protein [Rubellimicrobium sp. CFH 75288]
MPLPRILFVTPQGGVLMSPPAPENRHAAGTLAHDPDAAAEELRNVLALLGPVGAGELAALLERR